MKYKFVNPTLRVSQISQILFLLISVCLVFDALFVKYLDVYSVGFVQKSVFAIIFVFQLCEVVARGSFFFPKSMLLIVSLLLLMGFVSSYFTGISHYSLIQAFLTFQGFLVYFVLYNSRISDDFGYKYLIFILLLAGIVFTLSVPEVLSRDWFYQFFHSNRVHEEALTRGEFTAVQSVFEHPGLFSWFMAFAFCISCAFVLGGKRYLFSFLMVVFFVGVVISLRRKSIVSLVFVFLFFLIFFQNKNGRKTFLLYGSAILLLVMALFAEQMQYILDNGLTNYFHNEFYSPRRILLLESITLANDYFPLGTGFGTYGSWMSRINYSELYYQLGFDNNVGMTAEHGEYLTDTYWPMILGEFGWLGLIGFITVWIMLLGRLVWNFKLSTSTNNRIVHCAASLALMQLLIESLASPSLAKVPEIFFVMLLAGISCRLALKEKTIESASIS